MAKDQFCSNCGAELKETVKFCPACGKQIDTDLEEKDSKAQVNQIESDALALDNNKASDSFKTKYFSFEGRINRKKYFFRSLKVGVINMLFQLFLVAGLSNANTSAGVVLPIVLGIIITIPILISVISLGARRFHDLNKSGYYYFFMFIPLINIIVGLYLLFAKGTEGENKYGIDPLMKN